MGLFFFRFFRLTPRTKGLCRFHLGDRGGCDRRQEGGWELRLAMVVHAASYQDEDDDDDEPTTFDIHDCARKGQLKPLSKLLKRAKEFNIDVNEVDEDGRTPLMLACRGGQGKAVEYLMQAGASPDIKDNDGYAAVHFSVLASVDRFVGIGRAASGIRALAKYRAFMDRKTADGFTAGTCSNAGHVHPRSQTLTFQAPVRSSHCGEGACYRHYLAAQGLRV